MSFFKLINTYLNHNLKSAGIKEFSSHYIFHEHLTNTSVVVDLGANIGSFYSKVVEEYNCECIAVEASPELFSKLPLNGNTSFYNYAISGKDGQIDFYLSQNSEANSLNRTIAEEWRLGPLVRVEGITYNSFHTKHLLTKKVDILKVDIEGAELDCLEGTSDVIIKDVGQIPIEFHDFIDTSPEYRRRMFAVLRRLKLLGFTAIKISVADWREVLLINRMHVKLNVNQKLRLYLIHPMLLFIKQTHIKASAFFQRHVK